MGRLNYSLAYKPIEPLNVCISSIPSCIVVFSKFPISWDKTGVPSWFACEARAARGSREAREARESRRPDESGGPGGGTGPTDQQCRLSQNLILVHTTIYNPTPFGQTWIQGKLAAFPRQVA